MEIYSDFVEFPEGRYLDKYYYFEDEFSDEELEKIMDLIKEYQSDNIVSDREWLYDKIGSLVNIANKGIWNFSIIGINKQFQYTEHIVSENVSENNYSDWHMDISGNFTNRKITIMVQLNDPADYEGGDLQFMVGKKIKTVPKGKGTIVLFPSYFLHRVTPITEGVRKSLVSWVSGEPFR